MPAIELDSSGRIRRNRPPEQPAPHRARRGCRADFKREGGHVANHSPRRAARCRGRIPDGRPRRHRRPPRASGGPVVGRRSDGAKAARAAAGSPAPRGSAARSRPPGTGPARGARAPAGDLEAGRHRDRGMPAGRGGRRAARHVRLREGAARLEAPREAREDQDLLRALHAPALRARPRAPSSRTTEGQGAPPRPIAGSPSTSSGRTSTNTTCC